MKKLILYTGLSLSLAFFTACGEQTSKNDLAENEQNIEIEKPEAPVEETVPEGYEMYKSPNLNDQWKLSFIHPERASVDAAGNGLTVKYSGEDNSFYGGLTDGFIMNMTWMNAEEAQKHIGSKAPEEAGDYNLYRYKAPNSIGSAQVDHILVEIEEPADTESEGVYVDFATSVRGKTQSEYQAMIDEIVESMKWEAVETE